MHLILLGLLLLEGDLESAGDQNVLEIKEQKYSIYERLHL